MMASGSGKNQDDTETKEQVDLLRESNAAASASAAATEPPPIAPQSEVIEEEVHGPSEAGGREPFAATAAAAERKGEETMSLFRRTSTGSMPPLPPRPPSVSRARGPSSAGGKPPRPPRPMSREEVLASGMAMRAMRAKWKRKDVFNELMLECQRSREADQKAEAEGMPRQHNEQVNSPPLWPKKVKKPLWRKFLDRIGISSRNYTIPHVNYQCHFPARRNVMIVTLLILSILLVPMQIEAFQHFENIGDAAQRLSALNNLEDLRLQLEDETPVPGGFNFWLHPVMIAICAILMLGLLSWFIDPKEKH